VHVDVIYNGIVGSFVLPLVSLLFLHAGYCKGRLHRKKQI